MTTLLLVALEEAAEAERRTVPGRPHELVLDGMHRRLSLYFAGKCRYEPQGMTPAYRPDLSAGRLDIRAVDSQPIWLSVDGEVVTAESGFAQAKHPRGLSVHRRAAGRPQTTQEEGRAPARRQALYLLMS